MLAHVDNELFQSGFQDDPFRLVGINRVYLAPGTEKGIEARQDLGGTSRFTIAPEDAMRLLNRNELTVLDVGGAAPQDVTASFAATLGQQALQSTRNFVDVGSPVYAAKIGPEWYRVENGFRWMPKRATVELAGPKSASARLYVTGYGAGAALAAGPVIVSLRVKDREIGSGKVAEADRPFAFDVPIPEGIDGQALPVTVEVSRTFHPAGDPRELGLIFGTFEIK
jgi:hypothetical protein